MWKPEHRLAADRRGLRYPSDLTDAEWAIVAAMPARPARRAQTVCERARGVERDLLRAVDRLPMEGCLRICRPPEEHGARLSRALELGRHSSASIAADVAVREEEGRDEPDGGDHRLADREGRSKRGSSLDPSGYDAGKKIKGRKRHILVDTLGLLLNVVVHPADIQDRDGALHLLRRARRLFPFIERIFADGAYAGRKNGDDGVAHWCWNLQIVKRSSTCWI